MICARKIHDEWNIFEGIFSNFMFLGVLTAIIVGQIIIVQYGGWGLKVHRDGITPQQWKICIAVSSSILIVDWLLKCLPERFFPILGDEDPKEVEAAKWDYDQLRFRKRRNLTTDDSHTMNLNIISKSKNSSKESQKEEPINQ